MELEACADVLLPILQLPAYIRWRRHSLFLCHCRSPSFTAACSEISHRPSVSAVSGPRYLVTADERGIKTVRSTTAISYS